MQPGSAASAASAALDHMHTWWHGTGEAVHSMAVCSDGSYGVEEGLIYSYPVTVENGAWSIVQGVEHSEFAQSRIAASADELIAEREAVSDLLG